MVETKTGVCAFGWKAHDFVHTGVDGETYSLSDVRGPMGTLVVFICNHCPYVKATIGRIAAYIYFEDEPGLRAAGEAAHPRRGAADRCQRSNAVGAFAAVALVALPTSGCSLPAGTKCGPSLMTTRNAYDRTLSVAKPSIAHANESPVPDV